jgi:uncharacterized protein DUF222
MLPDAIDQLTLAVDALAGEEMVGRQGDALCALLVLRSRLDAQIARRLSVFDRTKEFVLTGARSTAAWLRRQCRLHRRDANRMVKIARQVVRMPRVGRSWEAGTIDTGHVAVLAGTRRSARAPEQFAEMEDAFVDVAEAGSPEDVTAVARQWRDALDADRQDMGTLAAHQYESRNLDVVDLDGGMTFVNGQFDPEAGAVIRRALEHEVERQRKANDERTPGQLRADACTAIFMRDLDRLPIGSNRPHVMMLGDIGTINGEHVGVCETDRGVRVTPETLRRVACDACISTAAVDASSAVLDMGRTVRSFTNAQRRAIIVQYPTCVAPGCRIPAAECRMHHLDWWDHDGPTDLGNGIPLCWHDHHLVHELGWHVERDSTTGIVAWYRLDGSYAGESHPRRPPPPIPTGVQWVTSSHDSGVPRGMRREARPASTSGRWRGASPSAGRMERTFARVKRSPGSTSSTTNRERRNMSEERSDADGP